MSYTPRRDNIAAQSTNNTVSVYDATNKDYDERTLTGSNGVSVSHTQTDVAFTLNINGLGSATPVAADEIAIYDVSGTTNAKTAISGIPLNLFGAATANIDLNSNKIVNLATPTANGDAVNKSYVDGLLQGLKWKESVRVATTVAGTLASDFENGDVIDGVTLVTGDRILIKNQAAGAENGIYTVNATGAPTRATDADTATEIRAATVFIEEGTVNADKIWALSTDGTITLGTTALTFVQISGTAGATNLAVANNTTTTLDITSDTGTDATVPAATATLAGLLSATTQTIGGNKTFNGTITMAANQTITLTGGTSGTVTVDAPAAITSYTLTLPAADGNANDVLTTDGSGNLSFSAPVADTTLRTVTAATNLVTGDKTILLNSTTALVTLPDPTTVTTGKHYTIKCIAATPTTAGVDTATAATIDGANSYVFNSQYESITVYTDGTNYFLA